MKIKTVIPEAAFSLENLLSPKECEEFKQRARDEGIDSHKPKGDMRHLNALVIHFYDQELADRIFKRLQDNGALSEIVVDDSSQNNDGLKHSLDKLRGHWRPVGVNDRFLVSRYDSLGHLGPHRDDGIIKDEHCRSLFTLLGYLTDRPEGCGGATRFIQDDLVLEKREDDLWLSPEDSVRHRIEADQAGKALMFLHDLMHDSEQLQEGDPPKWIFRTDIVFERDPETAPQLTDSEMKARAFLDKAEAMERKGDLVSAMKLYTKAYRLDPSLEHP